MEAIFGFERLARDPALPERMKSGKVARTGPIALLQAIPLGAQVPPTAQARLVGRTIPLDYQLDAMEQDLLCCMEHPVATMDLLAASTKAGMQENLVMDALVSLVRKGLIAPQP
jgi:hypothetical protein